MSFNSLEWAPFTPEQRRRQTAAEWMNGYAKRVSAQRAGPAIAAEVTGQGAELGRAWRAHRDRAERQVTGRARVERTLAEAALGNEVKRWQRERSETLGLIARAQQRAIPGIEFASRGSAAELRQLAGNTRAAGAGSTRRAAPGYGEISRAGVVTLPAAQCSFIHEPGPRGPHYGPCQPRLGY